MKKTKKYYFRESEISDGINTRIVCERNDKLYFGSCGLTKKRIRESLKRGHGRFHCNYNYTWKLNRNGSISFGVWGFRNTLPKRFVARIRKWARSR